MTEETNGKVQSSDAQAEEKGQVGRSSYTQEVADAICEELMSGRSLRSICLDKDKFPSCTTVFRWLQTNQDFREQYARAREVQAEVWADELNDIADDGSNDYMTITNAKGKEVEVLNQENIQRSRLRVDTRKWTLSKILPKKYGEKIGVEHSGSLELASRLKQALADES